MDHDFAVAKLTAFLDELNEQLKDVPAASYDLPRSQDLRVQENTMRQIINAYSSGLGDIKGDRDSVEYWERVREAATQALGMARSTGEIAKFMRPTSPAIAADSLHPWVWEAAAPLWAAEARQDAVLSAARTVNRRLQQKLGRNDIGETDLCMQTFDLKEPVTGKPRLRFPGNRSTPIWRARQEGAKYLSAGIFLAIRNVAAHEDQVSWSEQEALEHLATISVLARWIEECTVDSPS